MKYAVVCVDDDKAIIELLSFQLRKHFKESTTWIETYTNPKEVEKSVDDLMVYGIDILFLIIDYQMPEMNGANLIRNLKAKHPNLVCFMLSGQANNVVVSELINEGLLSHYIEKPWSEDELIKCISPFKQKASE
jgi:CheY-like chemotaxis protein